MKKSLTITLTPDIEYALVEQANERGVSPEELALESLRERFVAHPENRAFEDGEKSLFDYLRGHIGVIDSGEYVPGGAHMSKGTGKRFAEGMLDKRRSGKL